MRPFRDLPEFVFWKVLDDLAEAAVPATEARVRAAFLAFVEDVASPQVQAELRAALQSGGLEAAFEAIPWSALEAALTRVIETLGPPLEDAGLATSRELQARLRGASLVDASRIARDPTATLAFNFSLRNARSIGWLEGHGALFVQQVTDATRLAIRRTLLQGQIDFLPVNRMANEILDVIGLTNRQAQAVRNYRAALERLLEGRTSADVVRRQFTLSRDFVLARLSNDRIDVLVRRYRDRWLRHRSKTIAVNETGLAAAEGQRIGWIVGADEGLIDTAVWEREWVAIVPDPEGRTCILCQNLDDERAALNGGLYYAEGTEEGSPGPKRHIRCRCTERLVRVGSANLPIFDPPPPDPVPHVDPGAFGPQVPDEFRAMIDAAWAALPEHVRQTLDDNGVAAQFPTRLADVRPDLAPVNVPGTPPGSTANSALGLYDPDAKEFYVPAERLNLSGQWVPHPAPGGSLRHEIGHAIDFVVGDPSTYSGFAAAYNADVAGMNQSALLVLGYYLQPGERGKREAFAEAVALLLGGTSKPAVVEAIFLSHFGRVLDFVRDTLEGLE